MRTKYVAEHKKLMEECRRLHPNYSQEEMETWARYSAKVHVDRQRKQAWKGAKLSAETEERIWRVLVLFLLLLIFFAIRISH